MGVVADEGVVGRLVALPEDSLFKASALGLVLKSLNGAAELTGVYLNQEIENKICKAALGYSQILNLLLQKEKVFVALFLPGHK